MFVYKKTEPQLWTVGHYPEEGGRFEPESDHASEGEAAQRCRYLNGGTIPDPNAKTLRDELAMAALIGLLAFSPTDCDAGGQIKTGEAALLAYGYADAMLERRSKTKPE